MKRLSMILMCGLLMLGLAQCKKDKPESNAEENMVTIALYVGGGSEGGEKLAVTPGAATAPVTYTEGDVIYVGSDGKYIGYLTCGSSATTFTGEISADAVVEGEPLEFILMGGQDVHDQLELGSTEAYAFSMADQSVAPAVVSCGVSKEPYSTSTTTYTARLENKCTLVKFTLNESTNAAVTITGVKNTLGIGFNGEMTLSNTQGDIVTYGTGDTRLAVVPANQGAVTEGTVTGTGVTGTFTIPTAASTNGYIKDATMTIDVVPSGAVNTPLTFEAKVAGATVTFTAANSMEINMQYSLDGIQWTTYTSGTAIILDDAGDKVMFKGTNTSLATNVPEISSDAYSNFNCTGGCYIYGNIMSLLNEDVEAYSTATSVPAYAFVGLFMNSSIDFHATKKFVLPARTLAYSCYFSMFRGCTSLETVPELPAETLVNNCYADMFAGCTSLTTVPENLLPATTLAEYCYDLMFANCTNLTAAPELKATTLARRCYSGMFFGCTSLTAAPVLPATTLAEQCYQAMFGGCTSLVAAPELLATTLAKECYYLMFEGCISLTTAPALSATTLAEECYKFMFSNCTNLTAAPELPATTLAQSCYESMFYGCTSLTVAPELPARILVDGCCCGMFEECTNLNSVTCLATDILATGCTSNWMKNVSATGTFTRAAGVTWPEGVHGIPSGWTVVDAR